MPFFHLFDFFVLCSDDILSHFLKFWMLSTCEIFCHIYCPLMMRNHHFQKYPIQIITSFSFKHLCHISHIHSHHRTIFSISRWRRSGSRGCQYSILHYLRSMTIIRFIVSMKLIFSAKRTEKKCSYYQSDNYEYSDTRPKPKMMSTTMMAFCIWR